MSCVSNWGLMSSLYVMNLVPFACLILFSVSNLSLCNSILNQYIWYNTPTLLFSLFRSNNKSFSVYSQDIHFWKRTGSRPNTLDIDDCGIVTRYIFRQKIKKFHQGVFEILGRNAPKVQKHGGGYGQLINNQHHIWSTCSSYIYPCICQI